jgi:2-polyprenyl-3-methyl-5-hydroxy-6-metoxy-1,4-benzoquinol methylase
MATYVFDHRWQKERERLRAIELLFDDGSERLLLERGLGPGWSCLEVGCGAGGIALRMADRVGPDGRVVAIDLDTRFIDPGLHANLEVRQQDVMTEAIEQSAFDLVHARAVIEHIPDRSTALRRLVAAVRPGGWLLLEDVDFGGPTAAAMARYFHPPERASRAEKMIRAVAVLFEAAGADPSFGPALVGALKEAGLEQAGGELRAPIVPGGSDQWVSGTVEQLRERMVETGLVTAEDIDEFLAMAADPSSHYVPPLMVAAWGRRPAAN